MYLLMSTSIFKPRPIIELKQTIEQLVIELKQTIKQLVIELKQTIEQLEAHAYSCSLWQLLNTEIRTYNSPLERYLPQNSLLQTTCTY